MKAHLIRGTAVGIVLLLVVAAGAIARPQVVRVGNLFFKDSGGISPRKLPKRGKAPIAANLNVRIGTTDGSHPPALRSVIADFDRTISVNAAGLPVCKKRRLENQLTAVAKRVCRGSIVGSGLGEVAVAFPDQAPFAAKGPITLFNGGVRRGKTRIFAHAYVKVPAPTTVVATVEITRIRRGSYGLHTVTRVPAIVGGYGSVTGFKLRINRRFRHRGKRKSYLTAGCPRGRYLARGKIEFRDGTRLQLAHALPCTPMR